MNFERTPKEKAILAEAYEKVLSGQETFSNQRLILR
jgi:hypothetical protein